MVHTHIVPAAPPATTPPPSGGGGWGTPIMIPSPGSVLGDSQTDGRAEVGTSHSDWEALFAVYNATYPAQAVNLSNVYRKGLSGSGWSLLQNFTHYQGRAERLNRAFTKWQESGNQDLDGQRTPEEFGDTFDALRNYVHLLTPDALFLYQSASSFGREGTPWRDWRAFNVVFFERAAAHNAAGRPVLISHVERNTEAVVSALVSGGLSLAEARALVWFPPGHTNAFHFTNFGNLVAALSDLEAMNHDPATLDLSPINHVSIELKALAVSVIGGFH